MLVNKYNNALMQFFNISLTLVVLLVSDQGKVVVYFKKPGFFLKKLQIYWILMKKNSKVKILKFMQFLKKLWNPGKNYFYANFYQNIEILLKIVLP